MRFLLILLMMSGLFLIGCGDDEEDGDDPGATCCNCLVDNGCWSYDLCPSSTDCFCIYADSYSGDCPSAPCLSYASACHDTNCADACAGVTN
jgi:hypothetical protein